MLRLPAAGPPGGTLPLVHLVTSSPSLHPAWCHLATPPISLAQHRIPPLAFLAGATLWVAVLDRQHPPPAQVRLGKHSSTSTPTARVLPRGPPAALAIGKAWPASPLMGPHTQGPRRSRASRPRPTPCARSGGRPEAWKPACSLGQALP